MTEQRAGGPALFLPIDSPHLREQVGLFFVSSRPRWTACDRGTACGSVAKFWRLPRVEHAGRMAASAPEVAHDPERPCREAEAPVQTRLQGPPQGSPLRSDAGEQRSPVLGERR